MAEVTIRYEATGQERTVEEAAVPFFANSGWVVLDKAGRKAANQPTETKEK